MLEQMHVVVFETKICLKLIEKVKIKIDTTWCLNFDKC